MGWPSPTFSPGPIAVDAAVYVGYKLRGWQGATVCLLALLDSRLRDHARAHHRIPARWPDAPAPRRLPRAQRRGRGARVVGGLSRRKQVVEERLADSYLPWLALAAALLLRVNPVTLVLACGVGGALVLSCREGEAHEPTRDSSWSSPKSARVVFGGGFVMIPFVYSARWCSTTAG